MSLRRLYRTIIGIDSYSPRSNFKRCTPPSCSHRPCHSCFCRSSGTRQCASHSPRFGSRWARTIRWRWPGRLLLAVLRRVRYSFIQVWSQTRRQRSRTIERIVWIKVDAQFFRKIQCCSCPRGSVAGRPMRRRPTKFPWIVSSHWTAPLPPFQLCSSLCISCWRYSLSAIWITSWTC